MRKIVLITSTLVFITAVVLILNHFSFFSRNRGKMAFYVTNVSDIDSLYIDLKIDNKRILNTFHHNNEYCCKEYFFKSSLGKRQVVIEVYLLDSLLAVDSIAINTLITRSILVEFKKYTRYLDTIPVYKYDICFFKFKKRKPFGIDYCY